VDTGAGDTSIVYARPAFIEDGLSDMFGKLALDETFFSTDDPAEFSKRLADHWGYLSLIHPFRDGNTRSQSLFMLVLAEAVGHPIDWTLIPVDELRDARLRAMQGDERALATLLLRSIIGDSGDEKLELPVFSGGLSNTSGVAVLASGGLCGKPRLHGRGPCRRKLGENGCPYHG
jgi:cell filamentation protein